MRRQSSAPWLVSLRATTLVGGSPLIVAKRTTVKAFVDTNVLVYAYDRAAGAKHDQARQLVEELWRESRGLLSVQVLQEFYVNVRRKAHFPVSEQEARKLVEDYLTWDPIVNDGAAVLAAIDLVGQHRVSFWDALVVVAAQNGGASVIYSEDFNHGQRFGQVQILNPFLVPTDTSGNDLGLGLNAE